MTERVIKHTTQIAGFNRPKKTRSGYVTSIREQTLGGPDRVTVTKRHDNQQGIYPITVKKRSTKEILRSGSRWALMSDEEYHAKTETKPFYKKHHKRGE